MGMDSYLYRTDRKSHEEYMKLLKEVGDKQNEIVEKEINPITDEANAYGKMIREKYTELFKHEMEDNFRQLVEKTMTKEEVEKIDSFFSKRDELWAKYYDCEKCLEGYEGEELCYWRKAWSLHGYIVQNFWKKEEDNCVRIPLTKENLEQIVGELEKASPMKPRSNDNPFGKDDYWDSNDVEYTLDMFKNTIAEMDEDTVIYYYTWY